MRISVAAYAGGVTALGCMAALGLRAQCPNGAPPPCARLVAPTPAPNSVAVLSFASPDTADAYLADGLTEDIATLLGGVSSVQVKSPGVVRRAQHATPGNPAAIARALGVRYLVDGTVRRAAGRLRVSARLVVGGTAVTAWGELYDRAPEEMLALPSVIARELARRVGGMITPAEGTSLALLRTRNPAANEHYLRGNFLLASRSPEALSQALTEYTVAERLDPGFAAAVGRAAYVYGLASVLAIPGVPFDSEVARGLAVADRALRLDSSSSDAWMARGLLLTSADPRTLAGAPQSFMRAVTLDPQNAEAHHQYAQLLNLLGDHDAAERELRRALAIEPERVVSLRDLGYWTRYRDTAFALRVSDSAVALDPTSVVARTGRSAARLVAGDFAGAVEDAELANRLRPGFVRAEALLATALAHAGDTTRARALLAPLLQQHITHPGAFVANIAAALLALGDTTAAVDDLERADRSAQLWGILHRPEFDALRGNGRFERVIEASRPPGAVGP